MGVRRLAHLQGLGKSKPDGGADWSQLWAGNRGLMLLPCKQALGMWLRGPWRMDMQPLFKSALILDYSMCMIWTWAGKGNKFM